MIKLNIAPTKEPISLYEAKLHLRTDYDDPVEDNLIDALITTSRQYAEQFQHRGYITQTWELWFDEWPDGDYIEIPIVPLQSVDSITYFDTDGTEATLSSDDYFVDTKSEPGRVHLNYGETWPSTALRPANGVCVTFVAGYGDDASDVPESMRQAMLLLIGHLYENREVVMTTGASAVKVPFTLEALLWQQKVF